MPYKRLSRFSRRFVSPKFQLFGRKLEFFNTHRRLHSNPLVLGESTLSPTSSSPVSLQRGGRGPDHTATGAMLSTLAHERAGAGEAAFARAPQERPAGSDEERSCKSWASTAAVLVEGEGRRLAQRGERAGFCARWGRRAPTEKRARVYRARTTWGSRKLGTAALVEDPVEAARRVTARFAGARRAPWWPPASRSVGFGGVLLVFLPALRVGFFAWLHLD